MGLRDPELTVASGSYGEAYQTDCSRLIERN